MCTFKLRKAKWFLSKFVHAGHQVISLINFFLQTGLLLNHGFPAKTPPTWGERWKHWRKTERKLKITLVQNITFTMDHILSIVVPWSGAKPTWWRLIAGSVSKGSTVRGAGEVNRGCLPFLLSDSSSTNPGRTSTHIIVFAHCRVLERGSTLGRWSLDDATV